MISTNFYSQLTVCPVCQGYGEEKMGARKPMPCKECGGVGVFFAQMEQTHIWSMPKFVDFVARNRIRLVKIILIILLISIILFAYYLFTQIRFGEIQLPKFYGPNSI